MCFHLNWVIFYGILINIVHKLTTSAVIASSNVLHYEWKYIRPFLFFHINQG